MSQVAEVNIGRQGRLVIPADLRRLLGLNEGDRLIAREDNGRLILEKPEVIERRLKSRFAHVSSDRSVVDELIAERRDAARKEIEE